MNNDSINWSWGIRGEYGVWSETGRAIVGVHKGSKGYDQNTLINMKFSEIKKLRMQNWHYQSHLLIKTRTPYGKYR